MNRLDVSVHAIRRRRGRRRPFEVRWRAAGRARSKSFITRALADSYRAELIRAARTGLESGPHTGEPVLWAEPEPVTVTWYQHAAAYAAMYAAETGLLDSNPAGQVSWQVPKAATTINPRVVASPAQAEALLAAVARIRPALAAIFGCLYYGAQRPEEATALRLADCYLPARGWGMLTLTRPRPAPPRRGPAPAPATSSAASSTAPKDRSAPSPSRPSWSPCSATTSAATAPRWQRDNLRLVGLKLIFLIVTRAVSLLCLSRREWWWKDAEILMLRHQLAVATTYASDDAIGWAA